MAHCFQAGDPPALPFADTHPAWCAGYGQTGDWEAIGASVIGPGHIRRYRARDDAFSLMAAGGYVVAAVADGVGGELYSRLGAAHCVNAVCHGILRQMCVPHVRRYGVDDLDQTTLPGMLAASGVPRTLPAAGDPRDLGQAPENWARSGTFRWNWEPYRRQFPADLYEDDDPPRSAPALLQATENAYATTRTSLAVLCTELRVKMMACTCTLLVVAVDTRTGESVAAQLGDGAILDTASLHPVIPASPPTPEDNPFTIALANWREGLVIAAKAAPAGFLILTDGALDFFPAAGLACREILLPIGDPARKSLQLLGWLQGLSQEYCEDDRSIAAVTDCTRLHLL